MKLKSYQPLPPQEKLKLSELEQVLKLYRCAVMVQLSWQSLHVPGSDEAVA